MYGKGNYAPQFRHGPPATAPPPYQQGPPIPPPTYQQGPSAPAPTYQQGPPTQPPLYHHGGPPPPTYQQGPPAPPPPSFHHTPPAMPPVNQGHAKQVPGHPAGMLNMGQTYLPPPPSIQGSSSGTPSYPTPPLTQYPSSGTQNFHNVNPPVAPAPGQPLTGPSPPPPRVFHPVPSPGQLLYRTMPPPSLHGTIQGHHHIQPPLPPPPGLLPVTRAPFLPSPRASPADAHPPSLPPPPPPPPPSSPPPLPASPPPLCSPSTKNLSGGISEASSVSPLEPGSDKSYKGADTATQLTNDTPLPDHCTHSEVVIHFKADSFMSGGVAQKREALVDLTLPPPKPMDTDVVRNIEVLCQFIAKVGPDFENMARSKESGNPKFAFLFGGEPGSASAIGHEYFLWMKKKCHLERMAHNESEQTDAKLQSQATESSQQSISSTDDGPSVSPAVSDMEMEDDMDQPDKDDGACQTTKELIGNQSNKDYHACQTSEELKGVQGSSCSVVLSKGHLHATQSSTMPPLPEDAPGHNQLAVARPHGGDYGLISSSCIEGTVDSNKQASYKQHTKDSTAVKVSPPSIEGTSKGVPGVIINDGSPFKLIQDYASDDSAEEDKEASLEDVSPVRISPAVSESSLCLNEEKRNDLDSDSGVDNVSIAGIEYSNASEVTETMRNSEYEKLPSKLLPTGAIPEYLDSFAKNVKVSPDCENQGLLSRTKSFDGLHHSDSQPRKDSHFNSQIEKVNQDMDGKQILAILNVDEFGRLVREGGSDSDSGDMHYSTRRNKRGRSWSRSQSPQEGRRRRSRSPRRRRDKRSRSRSRSPKKHSNRNKSPQSSRRTSDFGNNERMRRDGRGQPECFNFLKGRCYRGSSCKFLHRDSAIGDGRQWNRSRQGPYQDTRQDTMGSMLHGDTHHAGEAHDDKKSSVGLTADKHDHWPGGRGLNVQTRMDASMRCIGTSDDGDLHEKKVVNSTKLESGQSQLTMGGVEFRHSQGLNEVSGKSKEAQPEQEQITVQTIENVDSQKTVESEETFQPLPADKFLTESEPAVETHHSPGKAPGQSSADKISVLQFPQANVSLSLSTSELQDPLHSESSSISHSVQVQTSSLLNQPLQSQPFPNQVSATSAFPNQVPPSQPFPCESLRSQSSAQASTFSDGNLRVLPSQIPPPPPPPPPPQLHPTPHYPKDNLNSSHALHPSRENNLQPPGSNFHSQPLPVERYPSYQPPSVNYHSQQTRPTNQYWASHPPFANESVPRPAIADSEFRPLQYQQNTMVPGNDVPQPLSRHFPSDVPQIRTFHSESFPTVNILPNHSYGGSSVTKQNHFMHPMVPESGQFKPGQPRDLHPPRPLREEFPSLLPGREDVGAYHSQHAPFRSEHSQVQSFTRESLPPMHSQFQQSSYGLQLPVTGSFSSHVGIPSNVDSSLSRYPLSYPSSNEPARLTDATGLKTSTSTHYNPFASTFEQTPASFISNSSISRREMDSNFCGKYDSPFSLSHDLVSGNSGGPRARHAASPPDAGRRKEHASGDQYDPIFDSIEPSSAFKKFDHVRDQGSHGPSDSEDKQKDSMAAVGRPLENDEYDGTAIDAEGGTVENASPQPGEGKNWSPTDPIDLTNAAAGEVEIDQAKSPGRSKKDSRSMKLFRIAIADFVKDILKPSWRQGNMSKEAFKTIVKKTVDKVSGAMQSHQIPKSQAKINQYVDSSRRKLTKLVMGYVDKYTK